MPAAAQPLSSSFLANQTAGATLLFPRYHDEQHFAAALFLCAGAWRAYGCSAPSAMLPRRRVGEQHASRLALRRTWFDGRRTRAQQATFLRRDGRRARVKQKITPPVSMPAPGDDGAFALHHGGRTGRRKDLSGETVDVHACFAHAHFARIHCGVAARRACAAFTPATLVRTLPTLKRSATTTCFCAVWHALLARCVRVPRHTCCSSRLCTGGVPSFTALGMLP